MGSVLGIKLQMLILHTGSMLRAPASLNMCIPFHTASTFISGINTCMVHGDTHKAAYTYMYVCTIIVYSVNVLN